MFKRFDSSHDVSTSTPVKSSVQRAIKAQLLQQHPGLTEEMMEELIPKKSSLIQYKVTAHHLMLYCRRVEYPPEENRGPSDIPILFQHRDGPILPTLKWLLPYIAVTEDASELPPHVVSPWTHVTVDQGAIPFVLGGANIMCPGLTKQPGSYLPPESSLDDSAAPPALAAGQGVLIFAEQKDYPIAVGVLTMSSREMYVLSTIIYAFGRCVWWTLSLTQPSLFCSHAVVKRTRALAVK